MYTSTEPHNLGVENSITTGSAIGWVRIGGDRMALRCCMLEKKSSALLLPRTSNLSPSDRNMRHLG